MLLGFSLCVIAKSILNSVTDTIMREKANKTDVEKVTTINDRDTQRRPKSLKQVLFLDLISINMIIMSAGTIRRWMSMVFIAWSTTMT